MNKMTLSDIEAIATGDAINLRIDELSEKMYDFHHYPSLARIILRDHHDALLRVRAKIQEFHIQDPVSGTEKEAIR